ncbi:MAG TPA: hypothetical protein VH761_04555, partial [Ilumatobacteraceae bacterium]
MADEPKATPEHVPDVVLEELLAAFSAKEPDAIDLEDPAIDHLLGLAESADSTAPTIPTVTDGLSRPAAKEPAEPRKAAPEPTGEQPPGAAAAPGPKGKVIVIGDDDLPDALYLDEESSQRLRDVHTGEGDDTGGRSTIVISDLDETGGIEALPARSSGSMDPRVRARRIAVRRAKGRKRLIWVAVAAAILLVLVGVIAVL